MAGNPIVEAIGRLLAELDALGIPWYAGGSVASSVHGIPRYTQDVDLVADLKRELTTVLAARLENEYYADAAQMEEAIRFGRSFNVIHFATGFKIDIFPLPHDEFHLTELMRSSRRSWELAEGAAVELNVASAEDTILEKLVRYKRGGQVADKQWSDVLGIATIRALDVEYLRQWAGRLGVAELLERLLGEARQV